MNNAVYPRLIADVGGTNARFAIEREPLQFSEVQTLSTTDYDSLAGAIFAYLQTVNASVKHAAIAIANPVIGDYIQMTNHHWQFSIRELQTQLGLTDLLVLNDFTAQALAMTVMDSAHLVQIGGRQDHQAENNVSLAKAVIGPGTGLGVSGLIPDGRGRMVAFAGEGGHAAFSPRDALEQRLLVFAEARFAGHVSTERLLCGEGFVLLHQFFANEAGQPIVPKTPSEITRDALNGSDALCQAVLSRYCLLLGEVCANVALTMGAIGGVYLTGGIVPRFIDFLQQSNFRQRFEDKGRFADYLTPIPVFVVKHPQAGLLGAAVALQQY